MRNRLPPGDSGTMGLLLLTSQRATNLAISDRYDFIAAPWNCIRNDFLSRLGSISYTFVIGAATFTNKILHLFPLCCR